jgi:hypothetical protein
MASDFRSANAGRQVCQHDLLGGLLRGYQEHFQVAGIEQIPVIHRASDLEIPATLTAFNSRSESTDARGSAIHFYKSDAKLVSVVANPLPWISKFESFGAVISPDLSLSCQMAPWQRVKNTVYSRAVGAFWQAHGLKVIPSIRWACPADYDFVSEGIPQGSVLSFGAHGTYRDLEKRWVFEHGVEAMLERLSPTAVLMYGRVDPKFLDRTRTKVQVFNYLKSNLADSGDRQVSSNENSLW